MESRFLKTWFARVLTGFVVILACSSGARADEYVAPTYENLVKMLVRFGAADVRDNDVLDSYAVVQECKLYNYFHHDDFKWHNFQAALRESIRQSIETFPTAIQYKTKLQLGRYDFKEKIYRFTDKTSPKDVNFFSLEAAKSEDCKDSKNVIFPTSFRLVLDQPLSLAGLPLSEDEGKILLHRMDDNKNKDHIVYTSFNLRVVYIAPLTRALDNNGKPKGILFQKKQGPNVRIDAHLASIDFYEDEDHTKLIYSYRP